MKHTGEMWVRYLQAHIRLPKGISAAPKQKLNQRTGPGTSFLRVGDVCKGRGCKHRKMEST